MKYITKLLDSIERCLIPKLSKNYEDSKYHAEFDFRINNLDHNFEQLVQCLGDLILKNNEEASTIISALYILYKELIGECPWNNEKTKEYAKKLNQYFEVIAGIQMEVVLLQPSSFNVQEIFDKCLETLHSKLTTEDFKKYPGLIYVFCVALYGVRKYKVDVKPQRVFPVTLLLIDDYIPTHKRKGLLCCLAVLQCMVCEDIYCTSIGKSSVHFNILCQLLHAACFRIMPAYLIKRMPYLKKQQDFSGGNYYEVVYRSLKRTFQEKDLKITVYTHSCLGELTRSFPDDVKHEKLNDMYSAILDQIIIESNMYRKAECLKFARFVIQTHGINCISRNSFKMIICDCLDVCTNEAVAEVLLVNTLECLEQWIEHCWCIWKLSSDYKMISTLLKVLYTCKNNDVAAKIQRLIEILICLCTESEKVQLITNLDTASAMNCDVFKQRVLEIKQHIKC